MRHLRDGRVLVIALLGAVLLMMGWVWGHTRAPGRTNLFFDRPRAFSGDEPHYLIVVQSILFDHDLDLHEDYDRVRRGGPQAGQKFRGVDLDHHTILIDPDTGRHSLWSALYGLLGATQVSIDPAFRIERSAHPIGFPLFIAALLSVSRPTPADVEAHMSLAILFCAGLAVVITFFAARASGLGRYGALIAALLLALASPWLAYSRSFFSEPVTGLVLVAALWARLTHRPVVAGLAVAIATIIKGPMILVGIAWLAEWLLAREYRRAFAHAAALFVPVAVLLVFNYAQSRTWLVTGTSGWLSAASVREALGTLIDSRYGVIPFVPWTVLGFALACAAVLATRVGTGLRCLGLPLLVQLVLLLSFGALGQTCYGPRYWVPFLPWLSICAVLLAARVPSTRWILAPLAIVGVLIAVPGALSYRFAWDRTPLAPLRNIRAGTAVAASVSSNP